MFWIILYCTYRRTIAGDRLKIINGIFLSPDDNLGKLQEWALLRAKFNHRLRRARFDQGLRCARFDHGLRCNRFDHGLRRARFDHGLRRARLNV